MGKRRELGRLGSNVARRQTSGKLAEQLGCPGGHHEYAHGIDGCGGGIVDLGLLARFHHLIDDVRIDTGTGMGPGDFHKGRTYDGLWSNRGSAGILVQRCNLKQHAAGIKGGSQVLAHRRLLASEQHDNLSPVVCHGRQQLEQAVRKRRDTAHAYGAGARRQAIGQDTGHNVSRLAGLDHFSTVQTARVGAQQLEHASLGVAFWLRLAIIATASPGRRPRHTRQHIAGHAREHAHRALTARKRLQVGIVAAGNHIRKQHLALQVVHKAAAIAQKLPQRTEPRRRGLVVNTQGSAGRSGIVTAQIELGKRRRQQNGTSMAGNQVREQRRLGIAQIRAGVGGIDSNRHGPPLKPFAIINASILPAHADRFAPRQQISSVPKGSKNRPLRDGSS